MRPKVSYELVCEKRANQKCKMKLVRRIYQYRHFGGNILYIICSSYSLLFFNACRRAAELEYINVLNLSLELCIENVSKGTEKQKIRVLYSTELVLG